MIGFSAVTLMLAIVAAMKFGPLLSELAARV